MLALQLCVGLENRRRCLYILNLSRMASSRGLMTNFMAASGRATTEVEPRSSTMYGEKATDLHQTLPATSAPPDQEAFSVQAHPPDLQPRHSLQSLDHLNQREGPRADNVPTVAIPWFMGAVRAPNFGSENHKPAASHVFKPVRAPSHFLSMPYRALEGTARGARSPVSAASSQGSAGSAFLQRSFWHYPLPPPCLWYLPLPS